MVVVDIVLVVALVAVLVVSESICNVFDGGGVG